MKIASSAAVAGPVRTSPVLLLLLAIVLAWSCLPALLQTVPHADNVEQLNWAHSVQWGYLKHPPLPTWLLAGGIAVFGPSAYLTYVLAMACAAVALFLVWLCARGMLDPAGAWLALLLTSCDYYLMGRGSFLNHNTVMLPFVAASAWCVLRIVRGQAPGGPARQWRIWALLGLMQGLGMLTKYQMAIIIAANALALLSAGVPRRPGFAASSGICALATLVPLVPHFLWLGTHGFSTFTYAGHSLLADLPWDERLRSTLGFTAQQLGRLAPAVLALGLALVFSVRTRAAAQAAVPDAQGEDARADSAPADAPLVSPAAVPRAERRALALLALTPGALILLLATFAGVAPQNHWGASATLLVPLWALCALRARHPSVAGIGARAGFAAALAVHVAAIAWNVAAARHSTEFHYRFAARPLAAMALAHWKDFAPGDPAIVVGPDWEAGSISLELPSHPDVIASGDRAQAPWIGDARLWGCGALVLWRPDDAPDHQVGAEFAGRMQAPEVLHTSVPGRGVSAIAVGVIPPSGSGCPPGD